jgi:hypothetical protein
VIRLRQGPTPRIVTALRPVAKSRAAREPPRSAGLRITQTSSMGGHGVANRASKNTPGHRATELPSATWHRRGHRRVPPDRRTFPRWKRPHTSPGWSLLTSSGRLGCGSSGSRGRPTCGGWKSPRADISHEAEEAE